MAVRRGNIGGNEFVYRYCLQHPPKAPDVVPVEVGQDHHVQVGDALLFQKITGVYPLRPGVQLRGVVVPDQIVVSAVHQQGEFLPAVLHLPDQSGIAIAYIDEIQ